MNTRGRFTVFREMQHTTSNRVTGRRRMRRVFKTSKGALDWLRRDVAAKSQHRNPKSGKLTGAPVWSITDSVSGEVLRVDEYGMDHGAWA